MLFLRHIVMGSTSKNKFAGAQRAGVAPHARPRQGSLPGPRSPGPPRAGRGPELQVGRRLCLRSGAKRRRRQGWHPPAGDRAPRSRRRGAGGGGEGGAPTSPASPKLSSGPPPEKRRRRSREPPERSRALPVVPASLPVRRARPSAASPLRPPAIRRERPLRCAALRRPLPSPRRRPLTHPRPASAATSASCPRSLPPVKLSPASLRPSSPRPAPPSPPGAAATAWALPQRSRAPPRPPSPGPAAAAAAGKRGKMGTVEAAPGSPRQRRDRAAPPGAPWAPPRRDAPRGEGGGGPCRAVPCRAVPCRAGLCRAGSGRAWRAQPPCIPREGTSRQESWAAFLAEPAGITPHSREEVAEPGGEAVEPGWQRRERLQAGRVPSVPHDPSAALRSKCAGSDNPASEERCSVCEIEKRV
ncbi:translation initiation factor IF-2-like [Pyrgilauda ruficollis]|uniref:translation initiation factor IF-2-like n=1 Tax=Pyrgilauda ruficollis TaxID=221976 RepID=UPI001B8630BA|nr:translation initiation factor IF-2-like [Pyrgilauda ruficollis]